MIVSTAEAAAAPTFLSLCEEAPRTLGSPFTKNGAAATPSSFAKTVSSFSADSASTLSAPLPLATQAAIFALREVAIRTKSQQRQQRRKDAREDPTRPFWHL